MSQKKNEGIRFPTEIRVVGSYTDRLLSLLNETITELFEIHAMFGYLFKKKLRRRGSRNQK